MLENCYARKLLLLENCLSYASKLLMLDNLYYLVWILYVKCTKYIWCKQKPTMTEVATVF